jgi:DNA-directed RNA polymerase subunit RPC12/RpoP
MVKYICDKCGREFDRKSTYDFHINRKFSCIKESNEIVFTYTELKEEYNKLQNKFIIIENENIFLKEKIEKIKNEELEDKIKQLENENKTINELYKCLLDKCLDKTIKNKKIFNKNCNNIINNTINNINVKLVQSHTETLEPLLEALPFGMENLDDLTSEEKKTILNAGMFCSVMCAKKLNCNPRLPQYQNIAFTNLRSNDAKIFDKDKTWKTVDILTEDLFETVIPRRIDDVNLLIENEDILTAEADRQHQ